MIGLNLNPGISHPKSRPELNGYLHRQSVMGKPPRRSLRPHCSSGKDPMPLLYSLREWVQTMYCLQRCTVYNLRRAEMLRESSM